MSAPVIPGVVNPATPRDFLEVMTRAVFQAGVSWKQIAERWDAYREAFAQFDPAQVARYDDLDVERVLATPGVMRTPRKVRATIANARTLLEVDREFGGIAAYLRGFSSYPELAQDFRRRFAFMGEMNVWYVLFRTGNPVPRFEPWVRGIKGEHPRMREMVELARTDGNSPERE
ncbi:MAG: DNA-3-methyladenine glycosylase I [Candidatus Tumulicola sp.]